MAAATEAELLLGPGPAAVLLRPSSAAGAGSVLLGPDPAAVLLGPGPVEGPAEMLLGLGPAAMSLGPGIARSSGVLLGPGSAAVLQGTGSAAALLGPIPAAVQLGPASPSVAGASIPTQGWLYREGSRAEGSPLRACPPEPCKGVNFIPCYHRTVQAGVGTAAIPC